jgi:hypothetical protein
MTPKSSLYYLILLSIVPFLFISVDSAFATAPTVVGSNFGTITDATPATDKLIITPVSIGTQSDRLLVVNVALDRHFRNTLTVSSVTYNGTGGCTTSQSFTQLATATVNNGINTRNEVWYLPAPVTSSACVIDIRLSNTAGNVSAVGDETSVTAGYVFFSGVDQTTPIDGTFTNTAIGNNATPSVSVLNPPTNTNHIVLDIMSTRAIATIGNPTPDAPNQTLQFSSRDPGVFSPFSAGSSTQPGGSDDVMGWSLGAVGQWASSVIVIRSCDLSSCSVSTSTNSGGKPTGDYVPPTLGVDSNNKRLVKDGFTYNNHPVDVQLYYTPYPLITTNVGVNNTAEFKIYDNSGAEQIRHFSFAFGLAKGQILSNSKAVIEWDKAWDGKETTTLIDPNNVLQNVTISSQIVKCQDTSNDSCLLLVIFHTFRTPLEFDIVATNVWDEKRNAWQNYYNHGIEITGESLNPPNQYTGIYQGHIYHLTETEKTHAIDDFGNTWTLKYNLWERDFIHVVRNNSDSMDSNKIQVIKNMLKDKSIGDISKIFGYDNRNNNSFTINKNNQILIAENLVNKLCLKCRDKPFDKIDNMPYYQIPEKIEKRDSQEFQTAMKNEAERASKLKEEIFRTTHSELLHDNS